MKSFIALSTLAVLASARNNKGVGKLPVMGYDTFNAFNGEWTADIAYAQAEAMVKHGLVDLGYNVFILDDYYSDVNRGPNGEMQANSTTFPDGIKPWSDKVKALNISLGAYSSNGYKTCAGFPGGYGHELQDLETFRSWGWTKLLKYDNCYIPYDNITMENEYGRFKRMMDAIDELACKYDEEPYIYSLCQWGWENPQNWAPRIAQAWRIDADIKPWWSSIAEIIWLAGSSYLATDYYQRGDLDILEVGNTNQGVPVGNLTYAESKTHFTAWALLKSHLLIGTDLTNATNQTIEILSNKELIDINQDPHEGRALAPFRIGTQPDLHVIEYNYTSPPAYWAGNSSYGAVFMIINTKNETQTMGFNLTENWAVRAGRQYKVRDMWKHENVGVAVRNWTVTLEAHDVAALLMTDDGPEPCDLAPPCAYPLLDLNCASPNGSYIYEASLLEYGLFPNSSIIVG